MSYINMIGGGAGLPLLYNNQPRKQPDFFKQVQLTEDEVDKEIETIAELGQTILDQIGDDILSVKVNKQEAFCRLNAKYEIIFIDLGTKLSIKINELETDKNADFFKRYVIKLKHLLYQNNFYYCLLSGKDVKDEQGKLRDIEWYVNRLAELEEMMPLIGPVL